MANTYPCADLVLECLGMHHHTIPRMIIDCESLTALHLTQPTLPNLTQYSMTMHFSGKVSPGIPSHHS